MSDCLHLFLELFKSLFDLFQCSVLMLFFARSQLHLQVFPLDGDVHVEVLVSLQRLDHVLLCRIVKHANQQQISALDYNLAKIGEGMLLSIGRYLQVIEHGR